VNTNARVVAYERPEHQTFEMVVQVRLAGAGADDWTPIASRGQKATKQELKKLLDGTLNWFDIIKADYPALEFIEGYFVIKAKRGRRY
jgi:hypothetical protein